VIKLGQRTVHRQTDPINRRPDQAIALPERRRSGRRSIKPKTFGLELRGKQRELQLAVAWMREKWEERNDEAS
jgi:hypothetical protein